MSERRLIDRLRPWNTLPQRGFAKLGRDIATLAGRPPPRPPPVVARSCPCGGEMALYSDGLAWEEYVGLLGDAEHLVIYCRSCGYLTYDPTPAEADVAAFYDNLSDDGAGKKYPYYATGYGAEYVRDQAQFALSRRAARLDGATGHEAAAPALRVFDLGCGDGHKVDAFNGLGHDVWGADIGGAQIAHGIERGNKRISQGDVLERCGALSEKAPFDLLHMFHVLEHLPDPRGFLARARELAADDTAFFIAVPNGWYLRIQIADLMSFGWHTFPTHLHFFTPPSLFALLEQTGWRPLDIGGGSHSDPFPDELFMDLFRRSTRAQFDEPEAFIEAMERNLMSCDFWILACADTSPKYAADRERVEAVRARDVSHWLGRPRAS